jgi:hypothetical protein
MDVKKRCYDGRLCEARVKGAAETRREVRRVRNRAEDGVEEGAVGAVEPKVRRG